MNNHPHTHAKECPDYKAAAADRAKRDATMKEREHRQQAAAHAEWMGEYRIAVDEAAVIPTPIRQRKH